MYSCAWGSVFTKLEFIILRSVCGGVRGSAGSFACLGVHMDVDKVAMDGVHQAARTANATTTTATT